MKRREKYCPTCINFNTNWIQLNREEEKTGDEPECALGLNPDIDLVCMGYMPDDEV